MMQLFLYWVAIVAVNSFSLAPLQDSIIEVSVECGDRDTKPVLKILTDVEISAKAKCNGGDQEFISNDSVHYVLPGAIVSDGSRCLFYQRENSDHYAVEVMVHYGEHGGLILPKEKIVTVICNYGGAARDGSPTHRIIDGPVAPIEIQTIIGGTVPSSELTLSIQTVDDVDAVSPIALDRRYSVYGIYTGARADVGLKPVSCDAVSNSGERYSVLRAGCGDGMIFDRTEGFTTTGTTFRSPYFVAFHLSTSNNLNFDCNVTLCTPSCDGSSCETDCGTLTDISISNTELSSCTGQKLGDTCTFQCGTGFDMTGNGISTCREDGIWTIPTIICEIKDCGEPPSPPENVDIDDVTTSVVGGVVSYRCAEGYSGDGGQQSLECLPTGQWSGSTGDVLQCIVKDCGEPPSPPENVLIDEVTTIGVGGVAFYICAEGYFPVGGELTVTCLSTGQWSGSTGDVLRCVKDCGEPPSPPANVLIEDVTKRIVGGVVSYRCAEGYSGDGGQQSLECLPTGQWSGSTGDVLQCIVKDCGEPPSPPENVLIDEVTTIGVGGVAFYICAEGYFPVGGELTVTCLSTGQWSGSTGDVLRCVKDCGEPPSPPANVLIEDVTKRIVGGVVSYRCAEGYSGDGGQQSLECLPTGQWSGSTGDVLQCIVKDCGEPPSPPENVLIDEVTTIGVGGVAFYICAEGYFPVGGELTVTCLSTGQWSGSTGDVLRCVKDCGEPPSPPANVLIEDVTKRIVGGVVSYRCAEGYSGDGGQQSLECLPTGQWSGSTGDVLQCIVKDCGEPPSPPENVLIDDVTTSVVGGVVSYICAVNYVAFSGKLSLACLSNGQWSGSTGDLVRCNPM